MTNPPSHIPHRRLSEVVQPENLRVVSVEGCFSPRLMEMGIMPGTSLRFVRSAPLKFPIEIEVNGFLLTLRKEEASQICVAS